MNEVGDDVEIIGIGLSTDDKKTGKPATAHALKQKLLALSSAKITKIAIWVMPIQDPWIPILDDWVQNRF